MTLSDSFNADNPFPVVRLNSEGRVLAANAAGRAMLRDLSDAETAAPEAWQTMVDYALLSGEPFEAEYMGGERLYHCAFAPNVAEGFVHVYGRDFTEQKGTEEALLHEKQLLDAIMDHVPDMIYFKNPAGQFMRVNQTLAYWLGLPDPQEVIGKTEADFFSDEQFLASLATEAEVIETGRPQLAVEQYVTRPDGQAAWLTVTRMPWRGFDGAMQGTFGVVRDITERKRVEAELQAQRDFALQVMSAMGQGLTITNAEGRFEYVNPAYARMLGYAAEALIGRLPEAVTFAEDHATLEEARRQRGAGQASSYETRLKRADGSAVYALITAVPRWRGQQVAGSIAVITDLTERRQAEEALRRSEAYTRLIVDTALDAVITADALGVITGWNAQAEKLFGWTRAEAVGHLRATQLLPVEYQVEWTRRLQQFIDTGDGLVLNQRVEYMGQHRDGQRFPVELAIAPIQTGQTYTFSAFVRDITERKEAEATIQAAYDHLERRVVERTAELSVSNARLQEENTERRRVEEQIRHRMMMEGVLASLSTLFVSTAEPDFQLALGMMGVAVAVNRAYIFTLRADGQKMDNAHEWCNAGTAPQITELQDLDTALFPWWMKKLNAGETIVIEDVEALPPEAAGEKAILQPQGIRALLVVPIKDQSGQLLGFMGFDDTVKPRRWSAEDIRVLGMMSEMISGYLARRAVEAALEEERALLARRVEERTRDLSAANAELARTARAKDEFLASMSHELRTPLNAILSISETLQEGIYGPITERQVRALGSVEASGRHLLSLINDILDLSKIEAGRFELSLGPVSPRGVCQASLQLVEETAAKKKLRITSALDSSVSALYADERRLKQMLVNLLGNAIKFTPEGGTIGLEMTGNPEQQTVRFTVWDTGPGIAPDDQSKLFKPFVQLDSRLARQHPGTGLGLALVFRMAELHGGGVALESEGVPGKGSRFTITLPWQLAEPLPPKVETPVAAQPPAALQRVLIVEDSPTTAEHLARYLSEAGAQVTIHRHGAGVVYKALETRPQVILLDLQLPDFSGWEVLSQLKAEPHTRAIPVIIISVVDEPARGLAAGAQDYMVKPVGRTDLLKAIDHALAGQPGLRRFGTRPPGTGAVSPEPRAGTAVLTGLLPTTKARTPLILLADDNEFNLMALSDYLTAKQYQLVLARTGAEALERARETQPDLILMDIQMPGMDGLEATQRLRAEANPRLAAVPIIALTALAMPGDRERFLAAGMTDYFSKPVNLKELLKAIETHIKPPESAREV